MVKKPWKEAPVKRKPFDRSSGKAGRNGIIAKVHIAKKDLGLDDDIYRTVLERITGHSSCSDMSMAQLELLLKSLAIDYGWKAKVKTPRTGVKRPLYEKSDDGQVRFFYRLFFMLGEYGVIEKPTREDANTWCRKYFDNPPQWLAGGDLNKACERLKAWGRRVAIAQGNSLMETDFSKSI